MLRWLTTGRRFRSSSKTEVFVGASRPFTHCDLTLSQQPGVTGLCTSPLRRTVLCDCHEAHRPHARIRTSSYDIAPYTLSTASRSRGKHARELSIRSRFAYVGSGRDPQYPDAVVSPARRYCHRRGSITLPVAYQTCQLNARLTVCDFAIGRSIGQLDQFAQLRVISRD